MRARGAVCGRSTCERFLVKGCSACVREKGTWVDCFRRPLLCGRTALFSINSKAEESKRGWLGKICAASYIILMMDIVPIQFRYARLTILLASFHAKCLHLNMYILGLMHSIQVWWPLDTPRSLRSSVLLWSKSNLKNNSRIIQSEYTHWQGTPGGTVQEAFAYGSNCIPPIVQPIALKTEGRGLCHLMYDSHSWTII